MDKPKMRFSQRQGIAPVREAIQIGGMDNALRNSIWNVLHEAVWREPGFLRPNSANRVPRMDLFSRHLWMNYFKEPIDRRPGGPQHILEEIRKRFFECEWYEVYDFLEFVLNYLDDKIANSLVNRILEREMAGFRFVVGQITEITDEQEIELLEAEIADEGFPPVSEHLKRALALLSDRQEPDYRNSIKESISAVESLARAVSEKPKATLGDALSVLERGKKLHPALRDAFTKLYGYTSDEDGIRHSMLGEPDLSLADARFFLIACTAFVHYIKAHLD